MVNSPVDNSDALIRAHQLHRSGQLQQAEQLYRAILRSDPEHAEANHLLGVIAFQSGNLDVASQLIAKAVLKDGNKAAYLNSLGRVLEAQGRLQEALMVYRQAIAVDPEFSQALVNSGVVLDALGRLDEALEAFDQALAVNPNHADAYNSRGLVLFAQGRLGEAFESYQRALSLDPNFAEAHNNLGNVLQAQTRIAEAIASYRQAVSLRPDFSGAHSNLLLCLNYDAETDARTIASAHGEWNKQHATGLADNSPAFTKAAEAERPLRIGYMSPDFCQHPVAAFIEPILAAHDRDAFEVFCYANIVRPDGTTERLVQLADNWRSIRGKSDDHAAQMIRDDRIDILVDLAGHTAGQRLLVFARRPAPIQVTWLGYPATSGLTTMDFRITDPWTDPVDLTDELYSEELIRLPAGSLCFQPPQAGPQVSAAPELTPGHVVFVSFNNAAKVSPDVVSLWAQVLHAVPDARLLLKSKSFGDRSTTERVLSLFQHLGIGPERIEFLAWLPANEDHLTLYNRAHIALDTFPYSGCTTTCEALWMGVPVITLRRDEPRSRMSLSILKQAGLDEFIADSPQAYVETAAALASDVTRLKELRTSLRARLEQSPLLDAARFTNELESAYRDMWKRYLDQA